MLDLTKVLIDDVACPRTLLVVLHGSLAKEYGRYHNYEYDEWFNPSVVVESIGDKYQFLADDRLFIVAVGESFLLSECRLLKKDEIINCMNNRVLHLYMC